MDMITVLTSKGCGESEVATAKLAPKYPALKQVDQIKISYY